MSQRPNSPQFRNQVLAKLSLADLELLRPGLEPVQPFPVRAGQRQHARAMRR
jgi:hypothetical protein